MPILACIGDIHGAYDRLGRVLADLRRRGVEGMLLTGDFDCRAPQQTLADAPDAMARPALEILAAAGLPICFVPGNHDRRDLVAEGNIDGRVQEIAGVRVVGVGGAGPARMGFPYEWSEAEIAARDLPDGDIVLTHTPPARTRLDRVLTGEHVGSEAIRELPLRHGRLMICGHIHEAAGVDRVGPRVAYNVGALGAPFERTQYGVVDFDPSDGSVAITHFDLDEEIQWTVTADLG